MKAAVFEAPGVLVIKDVPRPIPREGEALIRVKVSGLCATDVHLLQGESISEKHRYPLIPGHEFSGVIEQVHSSAVGLRPGDRVAIDPIYPCGQCHYCQSNQQNHCANLEGPGTTVAGGFAEFASVPTYALHKFETIDFDEAALMEPLATVIYGQDRARIRPGETVLIIGAGPIGLLHLQLALLSGATKVAVVDVNESRLAKAAALGADQVFHRRIQIESEDEVILGMRFNKGDDILDYSPHGYDVVIEATGAPQVVEAGLRYLKRKGRFLLFGVTPQHAEVRINPFDVYRYDWEIIGAFALNRTAARALELLEKRKIDGRAVIGQQYKLEELEGALNQLSAGDVDGKLQVVFP